MSQDQSEPPQKAKQKRTPLLCQTCEPPKLISRNFEDHVMRKHTLKVSGMFKSPKDEVRIYFNPLFLDKERTKTTEKYWKKLGERT